MLPSSSTFQSVMPSTRFLEMFIYRWKTWSSSSAAERRLHAVACAPNSIILLRVVRVPGVVLVVIRIHRCGIHPVAIVPLSTIILLLSSMVLSRVEAGCGDTVGLELSRWLTVQALGGMAV